MIADRWHAMVTALRSRPPPALPALPGRVIRAHDEPIDPALIRGRGRAAVGASSDG